MDEVTSYMGTKLPRFVVDMLFNNCKCPKHDTISFHWRRINRLCVLIEIKLINLANNVVHKTQKSLHLH